MKHYFLTILIIISAVCSAANISSKLDVADSLFIGTPFHLQVDITTAKIDSVYIPPVDTLDIFILSATPNITETVLSDGLLTSIDYTFQPFDVGEFTLPTIEFMVKSEGKLQTLKSDEFKININSIVSDSTNTIMDISKPLSVFLGFFDYLLILLLIALPILLIIYLRKLFKNRKNVFEEVVIKDIRPAYIICLEQIAKLKEQNLLSHGDFLSYYFRLSYILRLFIKLHYKINAVEMTTSEVRANLKVSNHHEKSEILKFLSNCDMIKFAKFIPSSEAAELAIEWLETYLQSFEPKEENNA